MKYLLSLVFLLSFTIVDGQGLGSADYEKKKAYVDEVKNFLSIKNYYTSIIPGSYVKLTPIVKKYFICNKSNSKKFYQIEEIVNQLEKCSQDTLSKVLRTQTIESLRLFGVPSINALKFKLFNLPAESKEDWFNFPWIVVNDSLIDSSNCFWGKINGSWRLLNRVDTIPERDRDFYTLQFKYHITAKPKNKSFVGLTFTELFYNAQDESINADIIKEFERKTFNDKYTIKNEVYGLVNSPNYRNSTYFKSPPIIEKLLDQHFKNLLSILPFEWKQKVFNSKVSFQRQPNQILWIKSDEEEKTVYVSSYLVRAVYMKYVNKNYFDDQISNTFERDRIRNLGEYRAFRNIVMKGFQNYFTFLILHELSHIKYNPILNPKNVEEYCDCRALQVMRENNIDYSLGIFEEIMTQAIAEGEKKLWDIDDPKYIMDRFNSLKKYKNKTEIIECNALITSFDK